MKTAAASASQTPAPADAMVHAGQNPASAWPTGITVTATPAQGTWSHRATIAATPAGGAR